MIDIIFAYKPCRELEEIDCNCNDCAFMQRDLKIAGNRIYTQNGQIRWKTKTFKTPLREDNGRRHESTISL